MSSFLFLFFHSCNSRHAFSSHCCVPPFDGSLWGRSDPRVELGYPLISGMGGGAINHASLIHSEKASGGQAALQHHSTCSYRAAERPQRLSSWYSSTRALNTLDSNSVQKQCGMSHKGNFYPWLFCEDKDKWFSGKEESHFSRRESLLSYLKAFWWALRRITQIYCWDKIVDKNK